MVDFMSNVFNGQTISTAFNVILIILVVIVAVAIILGLAWLYKKRVIAFKQFKCVIFRKDSFGQIYEKYDNAGIFVDSKTKNKRLFLKDAGVGLDPDNIPYVQTLKGKVIYLYQTGLMNFRYIKLNIQDPKINFVVGEEDVNWAINAYEKQKRLFNSDKLMQILPYAGLLVVSIIILVVFIYFFKNFDVLKDVAEALKQAAQELAKASADTVVIEGAV